MQLTFYYLSFQQKKVLKWKSAAEVQCYGWDLLRIYCRYKKKKKKEKESVVIFFFYSRQLQV